MSSLSAVKKPLDDGPRELQNPAQSAKGEEREDRERNPWLTKMEKMLTHNGSQPIEIGHSSDSGDQKNVSFSMNFSKLADESNIFKNLPKPYIIYRL